MSGSISSAIFEKSNLKGIKTISIHPMCPLSDRYYSFSNLKSSYFSLEGDDEAYETVMREIFSRLPNKTVRIYVGKKALYHLASVMTSNLYIALLEKSVQYLKSCSFSEKEAIEALYPLAAANLENVLKKGISGALTGPVERCDIITVKGHLEAMPGSDVCIYKELSRIILDVAKGKNQDKDYSALDGISV
jgi:predicted short-subunit dehydrogenase-like oxidoreductase (DUF2520 family)